jgi:periplasmic protein TonB
MELLKDKNQRIGIIGTLLFHVMVLLIFIFFGLKVPVPLPYQSIMINFGTSDQGSGKIQPEEVQQVNAPPTNVNNPQPEKSNPVKTNSEVLTQDNTEAISVENKKVKQKDPELEPVKEPEKKVNEKALFPGKSNTSKNSSSEGETGQPGDQGDPSGSKNATSHVGTPTGGGDSYSLDNRKVLYKVKPNYDCQEQGKVVVTIKVDKNGNVIQATPGTRGTTNTAACLMSRAEEAALKTKWEPNPNATQEFQQGTITYNFILN